MTTESHSAQTIPGPEHKKLAAFLGRWHTTGIVAPTAATPGAVIDSLDTYEWYPGGFFIVHNADSRVGDDTIKSIEIIGYDAERKRYFAPYFDSTGGFGTEELLLDGNTWTWRGSNVMGAREHRCVAVVSEDGNTIAARHEKSDDGKNWEPWMDVTLTRER